MRLAPFDFRLQAPLVCTSNAPPQITSTNVRRLRPIKCGPSVPDPDPDVRAAMSSEREIAACLRWLLDGAAAWRVRGCRVPASVAERANEAAAASPIAEFTATFGPGERIEPRAAFRRWQDFKRESGGRPGSEKALISNLQAAGWRKGASNGRRYVEAPAVTGR